MKKIPDRRPISTETTRSAPDVIIVSKPIRWGWPLGPAPWAPKPPDSWYPLEPRMRPEGSYQPHTCHLDTFSKSMSFDNCDGYYSQYFDERPKLIYDYCLKSDFEYKKAQTLPRNLGSSVDYKPKVYPQRSVCFYGLDDEEDCPRPRKTFVVHADIEPHR